MSSDLLRAGSDANDHAARLDLAPDCGSSSDETARGLGGLAAAVAGIAVRLGTPRLVPTTATALWRRLASVLD